jgi:ApbE superfamily uncharacterized protein (UPF0280 family)
MCPAGFTAFTVRYKETDLHIAVDEESFTPELVALAEKKVLFYRTQLEEYLRGDVDFGVTLQPHLVTSAAPLMALAMARAGNEAGVGPMAAVAGAFAEFVGRDLMHHVKQIVVENGGDLFLQTAETMRIAIFAGDSPFSNKILLELQAAPQGMGVCTSSGTVGPSLSLGRADAAVIVSPSTPLADAVATAAANRIQSVEDLQGAMDFARGIDGVRGVLLIKEDKLAAWGDLQVVPL